MDSVKHYNVIIIGAGPAGTGAAISLSKRGVKSVVILDRNDKTGGIPSWYRKKKGGVKTFINLSLKGFASFGEDYAAKLDGSLKKSGVQVKLNSQVIDIDADNKIISYVNPEEGKVNISADAIILATGSREKNQAERGWISGSRPSGVFFTKQLLCLMDSRNVLPYRNPVIIGSDLVGYAASAKLKHAGASGITIVDRSGFPACSLPARLYFRLWANPRYKKINSGVLHIEGKKSVAGIKNDSELIPCDGIAICGELIPNSELALLGGLNVDTITRKPVRGKGNQLSKPGWFAAGNVLGGFQSAGWCYFNGARVAGKVAKFIGKG